jgi:hypothetical protein
MDTLENLLKEEEIIFAQKRKELFISLENIKSININSFDKFLEQLKSDLIEFERYNK